MDSQHQIDRPRCIFDARGYCRNGPKCRYRHCPRGAVTLDANDAGVRKARKMNSAAKRRARRRVKSAEEAGKPECSICFEVPAETRNRYALLTCCDHAFCCDCLKSWRKQTSSGMASTENMHRRCPLCRKTSDMIVPSFEFCTGAEKERLFSHYRAECAKKKCHHFKSDKSKDGYCPFGWRCFFRHMRKDGSEVDKEAAGEAARGKSQRKRNFRNWRHGMLLNFRHENIRAVVGVEIVSRILDVMGSSSVFDASRVEQIRYQTTEALAQHRFEDVVNQMLHSYGESVSSEQVQRTI